MTYLLVDQEGKNINRDECLQHAYGLIEMAHYNSHSDLDRGSRATLAIAWMLLADRVTDP